MNKFAKKQKKSKPEISTASLPDIIFMLLFFFMVVTVLRDNSLKVRIVLPDATELTKLEKKSLVNHLYIGYPLKTENVEGMKSRPQLQLGDKFSDIEDIPLFLQRHIQTVPENQRNGITSSLRIDKTVDMGFVTDVKTALRKANQLKVNYATNQGLDRQ